MYGHNLFSIEIGNAFIACPKICPFYQKLLNNLTVRGGGGGGGWPSSSFPTHCMCISLIGQAGSVVRGPAETLTPDLGAGGPLGQGAAATRRGEAELSPSNGLPLREANRRELQHSYHFSVE